MLTGARYIAYALLMASGFSAVAQMYKWVDEDGTVHYDSHCPEGIECSVLGSAPAPPVAEVEAARQRSEDMAERLANRSSHQREEPAGSEPDRDLDEPARAAVCERAWGDEQILQSGLPVYRDAQGLLHHRQSLNDHHYQGKRHYLDDKEREQSLVAVLAILESRCAGYGPFHFAWVYRFVGPPNLDELLELLEAHPSPSGPPESELCPYARNTLEDFEAMKTGIPSDKERRLKALVEGKCS